MLDLEAGRIPQAEAAFREALAEWPADDATARVARHYLAELARHWHP